MSEKKNSDIRGATKDVKVDVSNINVYPGSFVTVYLHTGGDSVQVECHVDPNGIPRVLLRKEHLGHVTSFESYMNSITTSEKK